MIIEPGTVVRVSSQHAWVRCDAQAGCRRCAQGRGCGGGYMGRLLGDRLRLVRAAIVDVVPKAEDRVLISLSETALLKASLVMYLGPLVAMLIGAMSVSMTVGPGEAGIVLGGVAGFLGGLLNARRFGLRHAQDGRFQPVVLGPAPRSDLADSAAPVMRRVAG